jgi:hypothetical protein
VRTTAHLRSIGRASAVFALAVLALWAQPTAAAPTCASAIIEDWAGGAIESTYPLDCYDAAIDALPEDLRAYTTAADDISRAATTASRTSAPTRQLASAPVSSESTRDFPLVVAALGAFVVVLAASGVGAAVVRRRRGA